APKTTKKNSNSATAESQGDTCTSPKGGQGASWSCPDCERAFSTKTGLGVHRRARHPSSFHQQKCEEVEKQSKRRWTDEEKHILARAEAGFSGAEAGPSSSMGSGACSPRLEGIPEVGSEEVNKVEAEASRGINRKAVEWVLSIEPVKGYEKQCSEIRLAIEDQKMEYWKRVLGRESDPDGRPVKPLREPAVEIEEPISLAECKKALRDLKQTASGPDGVSWNSVKSLGPGWLQYLFNSILACGYPTKSFKNSRTVLIPKTEKPSDPGEFRPLAIASVFGRVFHRILASRLGVWAPLGASQRAFQVNPAKCSTLAIIWDGKNKRWLHDAKGQFKFRGSTLPALGVEESYKYLGLQYGSKGKLKTGLELLKGMLRELKEAPLKPQQRVFLLRTNILPKIMYYLVNGRVHQYTLRECDKCVRRFLREVLHLPHDTPVSAFHACAKDGGLDIDCFESLVPMYKWQKLVSLEEVPDNLVRDLSQLPAIRKRFQLKGAQTSFNNRAEYRVFWKNKLLDNLDGFGLGEAADVPQVHSWVTDGSSLLTGEMYIKCLKIRWNVWPTAARASRGRRQAPLCDAGCRQIEGLGHILQQCNRTWDKRGARHDRIVEFVGSQVERRGFNVIKEKSFATPRGHRRPDLIIYNKDRVWIADVTICADRGAGPMALARDNKIKYYTDDDLATEVAKVAGPGAQSVVGLVWNWRGCCEKKTDEWLKKMGVPIESRRLASVRVLEGSVWCAEVFRKRTGINFAQVGGRNRSE
uniref:C2H2-type domain-containing protein n=1 Tax=Macrostomum lignano TaxID=282301 RepID=A0A1I8FSP3_9PLAT